MALKMPLNPERIS